MGIRTPLEPQWLYGIFVMSEEHTETWALGGHIVTVLLKLTSEPSWWDSAPGMGIRDLL